MAFLLRMLRPQRTAPNDSAPSAASRKNWAYQLALTGALAIPILLETLDYTVVATAQPNIASIFNRLDLQSWIGTSYLLTSTVFLPLFASLSDIFGRHSILQLSILIFAVGAALCTAAQNMPMLLAGRGISGVGAAGILTTVRTILADTSDLNNASTGLSILFVLYAVGFSIGPVIGGVLLPVSFRWIFGIDLPLCAVGAPLIFLLLRSRVRQGMAASPGSPTALSAPGTDESLAAQEKLSMTAQLLRIDWLGATVFIVSGVLIMLALTWGSTGEWSDAKVIAGFVVGGLLAVTFILWQAVLGRHEKGIANGKTGRRGMTNIERLLPLDIFRSKDVCIVQYGSLASGSVMFVMFYFVATFMVIVRNLKPSSAGVSLIYFAPGLGVGSYIAMTIIKRLRQPRYAIILGSIISLVSLPLVAIAIDRNKEAEVSGFLAMAGVGTGLSMSPLALQARFALPAERNAVVTGLQLFARSLGGTIGLAQCGAVLNSKVSSYVSHAVRTGALSLQDASSLGNGGSLNSVSALDGLSPAVQQVVRDAYRHGVKWCFFSLIPWLGVAFVLSLCLSKIETGPEAVRERRAQESAKEGEQGAETVRETSAPMAMA